MEESLSVWLLLIRGMKRVSIAFCSAGVSGQFILVPTANWGRHWDSGDEVTSPTPI